MHLREQFQRQWSKLREASLGFLRHTKGSHTVAKIERAMELFLDYGALVEEVRAPVRAVCGHLCDGHCAKLTPASQV